ncbi:MAG: glycosyltransferase [Roseburia sp.]|nr:glycosyltransferase [Roseburia sp.]MCM1202063.1 glycosyltransferase [Bacteroides fragilis]
MIFFSIIVPVYNVEKYLEDCVQSILKQTFTEYEIILVDDGSTDSSDQICDKYARKSEKIKVIHKKNGGQSSARNAGIKAAAGEFLVFIDSDDYFGDSHFLKKAYQVLDGNAEHVNDTDVLVYGSIKRWEANGHIRMEKRYEGLAEINTLNKADALRWMVEADKFAICPYLHMIRRSFVMEHQLYFDETLKTEEDIEWTLHLMAKCPEMKGMDELPYTYRVRANSTCTSERKTGFCKYRFQAIEQSLKHISLCKGNQNYRNALYAGLSYQYYILLAEITNEPNRNVRKENFRRIRSYEMLQRYAAGKKAKLCRSVVKFFGHTLGAYILGSRVRYQRKRVARL